MKNVVFSFAFAVLLSISTFASPLMASEYIGEFCFRAEDNDTSTRMMKLGITHMGGNHFQIAGTWNWEDGSGRSAPINGNLEVIGNNLEATLTFSFYKPGFFYTRVSHLEIDTSSLSGNINLIKHKIDEATGKVSHGGSNMTVSWIPCP